MTLKESSFFKKYVIFRLQCRSEHLNMHKNAQGPVKKKKQQNNL